LREFDGALRGEDSTPADGLQHLAADAHGVGTAGTGRHRYPWPSGEPETEPAVPRHLRRTPVEPIAARPAPAVTVAAETVARHPVPPNGATLVLPLAQSRAARRTRRLRAWMITIPVDFVAMASPLVWTRDHWKGTLAAATLTVLIFAAGGLYRGRRHLSILDEMPSLLGRLLAAAAVVAVIFAERHDNNAYLIAFMRSVAISAGLVLVGRAITRWLVVIARRRRWVEHGAVIVGGGPIAAELARLLRRYPQYGLRFAGFVDDESSQHTTGDLMPWIGRTDDLDEMIVATESDVIIIADAPAGAEARLMELVRRPVAMTCDLLVVPRLADFSTQVGSPDHIGAIPVMRIHRPTFSGPKWWLKRAFDLVLALFALIVTSPVMLLCAIAVWIEGGRGVLFRQERLGLGGKRFILIKFRTLRPVDENEARTTWSVANDRRVGPIGRILRRTSLDELPQLWNVVRGDMTIVGPRPERPYFAEKFSAEHRLYGNRGRMPAGMTGLAQVSGLRGDTPIADRARFDNYYIENWSLWLDIKVLLRTFAEVFRASGR
jgi:exopolysaccharide biosynthesis polyprenyl glycosylphosphotransferase